MTTMVRGHIGTAPLLLAIAGAQRAAPVAEQASWLASTGFTRRALEGTTETVVLRRGRAWLPATAGDLRATILAAAHASTAWRGEDATVHALIDARVAWAGYRTDVAAYVSASPERQHAAAPRASRDGVATSAPWGELHPTLAPAPDHTVYIDYCHIGLAIGLGTRSAARASYVILCVDPFTRWVEAHAFPTATTAHAIAALETWARGHGVPVTVRSDGGRHFDSEAADAWARRVGTAWVIGCPYHPQGQGMVERRCADLARVLKALVGADPGAWAQHLDSGVHILNHARCRSTGLSPFHARYGHPARSALAAAIGLVDDSDGLTTTEHLATLCNAQALALLASAVGQSDNAARYNARHRLVPFRAGDFVVLLGEATSKLAPSGTVHVIVSHVGASPDGAAEYLIHRPHTPAEVRRAPASLLRPYDATRTDLAADAVRGLTPGVRLIDRIVAHARAPDGQLTFTVGFPDGSTEGLWRATDLRRLDVYQAYVARHRLPRP